MVVDCDTPVMATTLIATDLNVIGYSNRRLEESQAVQSRSACNVEGQFSYKQGINVHVLY